MNKWEVQELIFRALKEDVGHQDMTTANLIAQEQLGTAKLLAKASGILAGIEISQAVFSTLDSSISFEILKRDGEAIEAGDTIALVRGKISTLLTGERLALNFLQRLSGIATKTNQMVEAIKYYKAEIVDTRKTTPGLRALEKYAVRVGGGRNHRFGLYDGVMIKDNHIKAAGGITKAVITLRKKVPHTLKIEVEVENLLQLREALDAGVDIIMLDNMSIEDMKSAVEITAGKALLEASGGINESNLLEVARTGVDFISIGAITHSVSSLDISFDIIQVERA
ncbi:MAG: carboxylating nicotinate-nucleotide diphosphorylase [Syntrophomonadaceae bacterium]|jgi:nicotinate-nucleotide pyrophosphorylase (carboxylating)|nr:carboxylating nicotinate-nucleotide diphosphorylase [Syntrophomonadaceae bacterium]